MSSPFKGFSEDEKQGLYELVTHENYQALIKAVDEVLIENLRRDLIKIEVNGDEVRSRMLINRKLEIQGAEKLLTELVRLKESFRENKKEKKNVDRE